VDFFAGKADVGGGRFNVPVWDLEISTAAMFSDFAPLLSGVSIAVSNSHEL
jgi:hypothetical protein